MKTFLLTLEELEQFDWSKIENLHPVLVQWLKVHSFKNWGGFHESISGYVFQSNGGLIPHSKPMDIASMEKELDKKLIYFDWVPLSDTDYYQMTICFYSDEARAVIRPYSYALNTFLDNTLEGTGYHYKVLSDENLVSINILYTC